MLDLYPILILHTRPRMSESVEAAELVLNGTGIRRQFPDISCVQNLFPWLRLNLSF